MLKAIGRAQPAQAIQSFQTNLSNLKTAEQGRAVQNLKMQDMQQQIDTRQRQEDIAIADEKASLVEHDVGAKLDRFGDRDSPAVQKIYEMWKANGWVNMEGGGLGTINRKRFEQAWNATNDPVFQAQVSQVLLDDLRAQESEILEARKNKPEDEKINLQLQQVQDRINAAVGANDALVKGQEEQRKQEEAERETEGGKPGEGQFTLGTTRFDVEGNVIATVDGKEPKLPKGYYSSGGKLYKENNNGDLELVKENIENKILKTHDGTTGLPKGTVTLDDPNTGDSKVLYNPEKAGGKPKDFKNFVLSDGSIIRSFDNLTYIDKNGETQDLPSDAMEVQTKLSGKELNVLKSQNKAKQILKNDKSIKITNGIYTPVLSTKDKAILGTGPWSNLAALVDAVVGGSGAGKLVGADGLFKDTQASRQMLRLIKQTGKAALLNSSRGATWEQQMIDKLFPDPSTFFTNPRTEANKFNILRDTMLEEKQFNLQALTTAGDAATISKLETSNRQIDKLLLKIGSGETNIPRTDLSAEDEALINKYQ